MSNSNKLILALASLVFCLSSCSSQKAGTLSDKVECYNYSPEVEKSDRYEVSVGGRSVTVLRTDEPDIAIFGAKGSVEVKVTCLGKTPSRVDVRPSAKNYSYSFQGNTITLSLRQGDRVSVELDGDLSKPLFIFVNPLESASLSAARKDGNTTVFKAGQIYEAGEIKPHDGEKIYIQGGAVVRGYVHNGKDDILRSFSICGCGVLDARPFRTKNAICIYNPFNLSVSDITVLNDDKWTTMYLFGDKMAFSNYKVVATAAHKPNGLTNGNDAFNLIGCRHAVVSGCFSYAHDDAYCIKTSNHKAPGESGAWKPTESFDIHYTDCVAWNVGSGNSFEIGYELRADVHEIHYNNIYAIHSGASKSTFRRAGISIHQGICGTVHHIYYNNVWIEDPCEQVLSFNVFKTPYKAAWNSWQPGHIHDIYVKNLYVAHDAPRGSEIKGYDKDHLTRNIYFDNYVLAGKKVLSVKDANLRTSEFSENIRYQ